MTMLAPLAVGAAVREAREAAGLSVMALAERAGVSRAMIAKVEREEAQPTAALLGRLSGGLGISLSSLVARAERGESPLVRAADQPVWVDPATGYRRRALSPHPRDRLELVEVELPPGTAIGYPAEASLAAQQQVWVLDGALRVREGDTEHRLRAGDCVAVSAATAREYATDGGCRYLVALAR
ncbi:MAG TPA: helix-turn-helix domain-containing protein [Thermoleophilia bacterium]|nr:helix-turn-helix domain-containing protein [Thermoleophilia bacterium]